MHFKWRSFKENLINYKRSDKMNTDLMMIKNIYKNIYRDKYHHIENH